MPLLAAAPPSALPGADATSPAGAADVGVTRFDEVYDAYFTFVWRSVRRLGVLESAVDDAVQEIFVVVHRRLPDFEGRSALKTWIYGIVLRVVRDHRRALRRKPGHLGGHLATQEANDVADAADRQPEACAARSEAVATLHAILDQLDDDKREVLVLAELEDMTVPDIASAMGTNVNTVYSRLRAARRDFDRAVARRGGERAWRSR